MADGSVKVIDQSFGDAWAAYQADSVDFARSMPSASVDFSIYSPPFGSLFVYSNSANDMGNSANDAEFMRHYSFLVGEMCRLTKPGRLTAVHCSDLPTRKFSDGFIGLRDFPGDIIRAHQAAGWIYHSRATVWRCPVVEMTRTKALGLLYKQLRKDSTKSRQGLADYVLVFRAPGENMAPVSHTEGSFPLSIWQKWAEPVWMDIEQTNVLNVRMARAENDERHICPLQLDLIERAIMLWSNPGDVVLSPFMGIGSEGVVALKLKRKFIGIELKDTYFQQACRYLDDAERTAFTLFDAAEKRVAP